MRAWLIQYYHRELRCEDAVYGFKSLHPIIQYLHPLFNKALSVKQQGCSNNCFSQICDRVAGFVVHKFLKHSNALKGLLYHTKNRERGRSRSPSLELWNLKQKRRVCSQHRVWVSQPQCSTLMVEKFVSLFLFIQIIFEIEHLALGMPPFAKESSTETGFDLGVPSHSC